jgi:hypothetical protein
MSKPPGGDARELFIAAVVVGLPAVAEVVMEVTADDGDVPVTWIGSCGLVVSTASTILQLVDSGTCTGWAFAETFAEAEYLATLAAGRQRAERERTCN